jgi:hypothetical protein
MMALCRMHECSACIWVRYSIRPPGVQLLYIPKASLL